MSGTRLFTSMTLGSFGLRMPTHTRLHVAVAYAVALAEAQPPQLAKAEEVITRESRLPSMSALDLDLLDYVRLGLLGSTIGRLHAKSAVIDRRILFIGSMNFDPRSDMLNTEIGLFIQSPEMAQQVLKLVDVLKQQGAYRLQFAADGRSLEWVGGPPGRQVVLTEEPDSTFWSRIMLELLAPLTPESVL